MERRKALALVGAVAGFLWGKPVFGQGYLRIVLDGTEGVVVSYRGQQVLVRPQEIIDALRQGGQK